MRIAFVVDSAEFAGAELYAETLFDSLRDRCEFVAIVGSHAPAETRSRLQAAGAEIRVVEGLARRPSVGGVVRLARALREIRPVLVHANLTDQGDGIAVVAGARLARRPAIATLHLVLPQRAGWREVLSRRVLRRFQATVAVSRAVRDYLNRLGAPTTVVHNGLRPTPPTPDARRTLGIRPDGPLVGGIGRLHDQKGWDFLCQASPLVLRERPDIVFAVVGEGPERERLAATPGCEHVRFLGYRPSAASLIPAFDVIVAPSRYESFGLVPLEALFQGVPIVASDIEEFRELLGDTAIFVPAEDPEALAAGIVQVVSDRALREDMVTRGRRRAEERFGADRMAAETLAVYLATVAP